MPYTISGTVNTPSRILILNQSDWSISNNNVVVSSYEITTTNGNKVVIARSTADGQVVGYGGIAPVFIPDPDATSPTVVITVPTSGTTYATPSATITLSGTATDNVVVNSVRWLNATTTVSGNASGTTGWQSSSISLNLGSNTLNVYATDLAGNTGSDTLTVTRNGDRAVFPGGGALTSIDYFTISTTGNAINFGTIRASAYGTGSTSNGITGRGLIGGTTNAANYIDYITIMSPNNAIDFGDLTYIAQHLGATSNNTNNRGIFGGGYGTGYRNDICYVTISTAGNATDFGDITTNRRKLGSTSNGTNNRGIFMGGHYYNFTDSWYNIIDYVTIPTAGNAADFGDLLAIQFSVAATSNLTNNRGIISGGALGTTNVIQYVTISTASNATDFGDMLSGKYGHGSTSNGVHNRGVMGGGQSSVGNTIEYITITSTGNATDFGDLLSTSRSDVSALSNG